MVMVLRMEGRHPIVCQHQDGTRVPSCTTKANTMRRARKRRPGIYWYAVSVDLGRVLTNNNTVLPLRPLCTTFRRHHPLDHSDSACLPCSGTPEVMLNTALALRTAHHVSRPSAQPSAASRVLARLVDSVQRPYASRHPPLLAYCCIRRRSRSLDCCRILVLLFDTGRPWRSRRTQ